MGSVSSSVQSCSRNARRARRSAPLHACCFTLLQTLKGKGVVPVTAYQRLAVSSYGSVQGAVAMMREITAHGPIACSLQATTGLHNFSGDGVYKEFLATPKRVSTRAQQGGARCCAAWHSAAGQGWAAASVAGGSWAASPMLPTTATGWSRAEPLRQPRGLRH